MHKIISARKARRIMNKAQEREAKQATKDTLRRINTAIEAAAERGREECTVYLDNDILPSTIALYVEYIVFLGYKVEIDETEDDWHKKLIICWERYGLAD